jgi:steroid delta-isomerase-like uncharacterized protein
MQRDSTIDAFATRRALLTVLCCESRASACCGNRLHSGLEDGMDHAVTMRRMYDLLNAGDIDGFGNLLADDFVDHEELPDLGPTKEGAMAFFRMFVAAFPDLRMAPEDVIASGDKVVARVRATGTHKGAFMSLSPTGRRVEVQLIDIIRFGADGRAREHWGIFDQLAMMQQLGAIPAGPPA